MHLARCFFFTALLGAWIILPAPLAAQVLLFGKQEVASANLKPFPKWTGVLERNLQDMQVHSGPCAPSAFTQCYIQDWKTFLDTLRGKDKKTQLEMVNSHMNAIPYVLDIVNWGMQDYWATPYQFFVKYGDCEDYAIAKFMSLRALGFRNQDMRVVVLQDLNLGVMHAILSVYIEGEAYILDNQISQVVNDKKILHYNPIYSINETTWWRHT